MNTIDYIILAVVLVIVGSAALYIYRAKKRGKKCIGCPSAHKCSGQCASCAQSCGTCKK